jgi:3-hydroxyisobutyrate dehydrogenase-like beta-hydroxyacid dehydrogenase
LKGNVSYSLRVLPAFGQEAKKKLFCSQSVGGWKMAQRLGLIGVGRMGRPIAENLLQKGFQLTIFARRDDVKDQVGALGARVAASPSEVAEHSDIIFLIVTDSHAVKELIFGKSGIIHGASKGTIVVDMTTSDPRSSKKFEKQLADVGYGYLDAPISGGVLGAKNAELLIIVGGRPETYESCLPVFKMISKKTIYVGEAGNGHLMKLIHNQLTHATFIASCEAVLLGKKLGLPMDLMVEVFNHGTARSYATEVRFPKFILPQKFEMGSTFFTAHKDISIIRKLAKRGRVKLPVNECTFRFYKHVIDAGKGQEDFSKTIMEMEPLLNK